MQKTLIDSLLAEPQPQNLLVVIGVDWYDIYKSTSAS